MVSSKSKPLLAAPGKVDTAGGHPVYPAQANVLRMAWITTGYPPEVSGVSLGNHERARWIGAQGRTRLTVLAPAWTPDVAATPNDRPGTDDEPGLSVVRYADKPFLPYRLMRVPRRRAVGEIDAVLEREHPDVIVVTDAERVFVFGAWALPGRAYARRHGVPYVAHFHTDVLNFSRTHPFWRLTRALVLTPLVRHLYRQFDMTIAATANAAARLRELGVTEVHQVPFIGIDVTRFSPDLADRAGLAAQVPGWQPTDRVLLTLCRLSREKRVDLVIRAFHELSATEPGLRLLIAGDGPARVVCELRRLAGASDRIHFLGFVTGQDRARLFASCDVFCTASPYETFGRTVVEAMASGVPVVAAGNGAVTDYLVSGDNCLLFSPGQVPSLVAALRQALGTDTADLVRTARQVSLRFSVESGCQRLLDFYDDLLGDPARLLSARRQRFPRS
jgi:glycosyltransferase involved in cell wall biosynthesis